MLSLILPTFNESGNIVSLLQELSARLAALDYEIIVVDDDSPDGTWKLVQEYGEHDSHVRVVRRMGSGDSVRRYSAVSKSPKGVFLR